MGDKNFSETSSTSSLDNAIDMVNGLDLRRRQTYKMNPENLILITQQLSSKKRYEMYPVMSKDIHNRIGRF